MSFVRPENATMRAVRAFLERLSTPRALMLAWCFIGVVSIYDAYLVVIYRTVITRLERNPVCLYLINLDPESLSYFLFGKFLGTVIVLSTMAMIYRYRKRWATPIFASVASFQLGLLLYLNLANG